MSSSSASKKRFFSQCFSFHGLNVSVSCLNNFVSSGIAPRIDSSSISKSASLLISYASSIHAQHRYPRSTVIDVTFIGSSRPLKYIFCPVGLYVISKGDSLTSHSSSTLRRCMAHLSSVKQESLSVLYTFRTTSVFASGYFIMFTINQSAVVFDFLLALEPLTTL